MPREVVEHSGMDEDVSPKEGKNRADQPVDTLYYKPFKGAEREGERLTLRKMEESEEKAEKMKERFGELMLMFSEGRLDTPVEVAGENHIMELNKIFKGEEEVNSGDIIRKVNEGLNPASINIGFKLSKTEGRPEALFIDLKVSAARLLEGGGDLKEDLKKNITGIFAGTSRHYENIREEKDRAQETETPRKTVESVEKKTMAGALESTGAFVSHINNGDVYTLVAEYPDTGKKVMISLFNNREPWYLETAAGNEDKNENFTGPPGEVLAEIYRFIESE